MSTGQPVEWVKPAARAAWSRLSRAIDTAEDHGHSLPCIEDPTAFTSDDPEDRRVAVRCCPRCPVVTSCAAFALANGERGLVWGGVDTGAGARDRVRDLLAAQLEGDQL